MLTRELLELSFRKGMVRPRLVDPEDPALLDLAEELVEIATAGVGEAKGDLEEALVHRAGLFPRQRVSRGLVKLVMDRTTVREPDSAVLEQRAEAFEAAMSVLSSLSPDASFETYEAELSSALSRPLAEVRRTLHDDLPDARLVEAFEPIAAKGLLERYNLALAQGLVMYTSRLELRLPSLERPEVRRLLRWLRFCRLVAESRRDEEAGRPAEGLLLGVEGPAAMFEGARSYGLQLASFFAAVPSLTEWSLQAEVRLPRRPPARLELGHEDGLVSSFAGGAGYVPEEIRAVLEKLELPGVRVDLAPAPRPMGARGLAVPDFALVPAEGAPIVVELFHRWHRGLLERRLLELEEAPDPSYRIGVDRSLLRDPEVAGQVDGHPQVFLFRSFPTARALQRLARADEP